MNDVLKILSPFQNKKQVVSHSQSVGDIITGILKTHENYRNEYDKICMKFNANSASQIGHKIYNYLHAHTHYVVESDSKQTLRSPSAILTLGANPKIGLDCKSYSLFIGGIIDALNRRGKNIKWCYRFASYKMFDKLPHHVFVVINPNTKNEIWVDPVLPTFNNKKSYNFKIDRNPMALIAVAGIGRARKTKAEKKEKRKKIVAKLKKAGKVLVKFNPATVSARNSFLLLVKVNFLQLAVKLQKLNAVSNDLRKFWDKLGGNYNNLLKNIEIGVKHHNKRHKVNGIGVVPAIAGAIAAATPIVIKIVALLKKAGIDTTELQKAGNKVLKSIVNKKVDEMAENEDDVSDEPNDSDNNDASNDTEGDSSDGDGVAGISKNTIMLGVGALGIAYAISKSKPKKRR